MSVSRKRILSFALFALAGFASSTARAVQPTPEALADPNDAPPPTGQAVEPADAKSRSESATPAPAEAPPSTRPRFDVDPVADGALILGAGGFALLLDEVNSTGEIRPQEIARDFDRSQLLRIDRIAIEQDPNSFGGTMSNVGLFATIGYAVIDPVFSGLREHSVQTAIVDAFMYAESSAITWGITNLAKIAVRRPRPIAYIEAEKHRNDPNYSNADTDSALSFFSGHSSVTATIAATATYLAFVRSPRSVRPWLTLVGGVAVTSLVSAGRVMSAKHFPTDVIAGALAGAGVGVLVPLVHRSDGIKQRAVWVGFEQAPRADGGVLTLGGAL